MNQSGGLHIIATFAECQSSYDMLDKYEIIGDDISRLIEDHGLTLVTNTHHPFDKGYTAAWLLAESHLSVHTWPEERKVHFDLFVCNYSRNNSEIARGLYEVIKEMYLPSEVHEQFIERE